MKTGKNLEPNVAKATVKSPEKMISKGIGFHFLKCCVMSVTKGVSTEKKLRNT